MLVRGKRIKEDDFASSGTHVEKALDNLNFLLRIEAPVDECIKLVSESTPVEVEKRKMRRVKRKQGRNSLGHEAIDHVHPEDNSVTKNTVLEKDTSSLPSANMFSDHLQEVASETTTAPFRVEAPVDESIKPVSEKDSCVEPTTNLEKDTSSLPSANMFSDHLLEVASETTTAPFRIEAPVDESIKPVSEKDSCVEPTTNLSYNTESTPVEVEVPDDLSKKMDFVAASVEIEAEKDPLPSYLKILQKRKMRRVKRKQGCNSLGHEAIDHVHPEDNSVTKNTVLEKDTSSLPSANMFSEKQPK
ncbi:hypothetical protein Q3G72_005671 [Acer saccharum]|nr:hypothetical protein Q3G72_005671 [Acer saccharum]